MSKFTLKGGEDFDAIILSFHSHWAKSIASGEVSAVFRKKGPKRRTPKWMYAYFSIPLSAIAAKLVVKNVEFLPIDKAVAHSKAGMLSEKQVREYADDGEGLFVYHLGRVVNAMQPIALERLVQQFGFWPSANYIPVSDLGVQQLDALLRGQDK